MQVFWMQISANSLESAMLVAEILQRMKRIALKILTSVKFSQAMILRVLSSCTKRNWLG